MTYSIYYIMNLWMLSYRYCLDNRKYTTRFCIFWVTLYSPTSPKSKTQSTIFFNWAEYKALSGISSEITLQEKSYLETNI